MGTKPCEICESSPARYVCQECGRNVCERCLEPHTWLCADCWKQIKREVPKLEAKGVLASLPSSMKVFLIGFSLIFVGVVVVMIATLIHGFPGSAGLIVFIGPIPIILGTGEYSLLAIVLAIISTIVCIAFFIIFRKQKRQWYSPSEKLK